jgi:hypothetical protein
MTSMTRTALMVIVGALTGLPAVEASPVSPAEAHALAEFQEDVQKYLALHGQLEATLPKLPREPTAEQIDGNQRALGDLIRSARSHAKPGEFFTSKVQAVLKRIVGEVLSGPDGAEVKASIMDENPGVPGLKVNERYPAAVPLSTMPPQVLAALPKLPQELEYRFVGARLILLDTHADIILDFVEGVLAP